MMFTIDNTPKNSSYLKKGLNKLRSSTRKSPGKSSKKAPAQTSARRYQENVPSRNSNAAVGRAGRIGSFKSPQVATKGQRNSPRATSRNAKSPGLTASARKVNTHRQIHSGFYRAHLSQCFQGTMDFPLSQLHLPMHAAYCVVARVRKMTADVCFVQ